MKHSFHFNDQRTSWAINERDKQKCYRCAPKLTHSHVYPSTFEKMRVSLASQVLSHTVASGMNTYVTWVTLPASAFATIEVIERFNDLFDILNSCMVRDPAKFKNAYDASDFQLDFSIQLWIFKFLKNN